MVVESVTWVARRLGADSPAQVVSMARALRLEVVVASEALVVLRTQRGDVLEFCGPGHPVPEHLFASGDTVVGFEVDDLEAAAEALGAAGFRLLAEPATAGDVRFLHFVGPDARVYGLVARLPTPRSDPDQYG